MILTEVYFAEMNKSYDFRLEEDAPVGQLIEDMVSKIAQIERIPLSKHPGFFILCRKRDRRIFDHMISLAGHGVCSGDRLMLI